MRLDLAAVASCLGCAEREVHCRWEENDSAMVGQDLSEESVAVVVYLTVQYGCFRVCFWRLLMALEVSRMGYVVQVNYSNQIPVDFSASPICPTVAAAAQTTPRQLRLGSKVYVHYLRWLATLNEALLDEDRNLNSILEQPISIQQPSVPSRPAQHSRQEDY